MSRSVKARVAAVDEEAMEVATTAEVNIAQSRVQDLQDAVPMASMEGTLEISIVSLSRRVMITTTRQQVERETDTTMITEMKRVAVATVTKFPASRATNAITESMIVTGIKRMIDTPMRRAIIIVLVDKDTAGGKIKTISRIDQMLSVEALTTLTCRSPNHAIEESTAVVNESDRTLKVRTIFPEWAVHLRKRRM